MIASVLARLGRWVCLLAVAVTLAVPAAQPVAAAETQCFPETGHCAQGAFFDFWRTHGQVPVLGFPVGPAVVDETGRLVQYYERAILEWHPAELPPYQVQLALLGDQRLGNRPQRYTPPDPICPPTSCRLAVETNHSVRDAFLSFWRENGGLPVFGLPLTEAFDEIQGPGQARLVQYFERARFELDPDSGTVQLGRLGADAWLPRTDLHRAAAVPVPDYAIPLPVRPVTLAIPALGLTSTIEAVGVDAAGNMDVPSGPSTVAWYAYGARPGDLGNAVVAGHVDYRNYGPAVFWRLREMQVGDEIWVTDATGPRRRFRVYDVASYRAADAPLERIFGSSGGVYLNLITCVGTFNGATGEYDRRLVVFARLDGYAR
ncbi:MAG: class F sortase [Chloroflexi bacterium]|nr:class F sortase [Chloroflexota bacterium]